MPPNNEAVIQYFMKSLRLLVSIFRTISSNPGNGVADKVIENTGYGGGGILKTWQVILN